MSGTDRARIAVITGASSGIGAATARALARLGFELYLGARRRDRLAEVARETRGVALSLDVTKPASITRFAATLEKRAGRVDVLVNNAGLALGLTPVGETEDRSWTVMWETNVLGLLRVTRALLPLLRKAPLGHIVNLGSTASFETYVGGGGYTASKHAVRAISRTLRLELLGEPIRISEIDPGLVETEFSVVRFGDEARAKQVYQGIEPLTAEDIADCIAFCVTRPPHVDIDEMTIRPVRQANSTTVVRD
ncbi:MAG TPA: SDR family NAD(P)-dependent oxidoreductase [Candidatus Dormibacteraeota bacterium]